MSTTTAHNRRRRVQIAIRAAGWRSIRALAVAIGCAPSHLLRVLDGERPASAELVAEIVARLGVERWFYVEHGGALLAEDRP